MTDKTTPVSHTPGPWSVEYEYYGASDPEEQEELRAPYHLVGPNGKIIFSIDDWDDGGTVCADAELAASAPELKAENEKLIEALEDMVAQCCEMNGIIDSHAMGPKARAIHILADKGLIVIEKEYGRRVIGRWTERSGYHDEEG